MGVKNFLENWYSVDSSKNFNYKHGVYKRVEGGGKAYTAAMIALIEAFYDFLTCKTDKFQGEVKKTR